MRCGSSGQGLHRLFSPLAPLPSMPCSPLCPPSPLRQAINHAPSWRRNAVEAHAKGSAPCPPPKAHLPATTSRLWTGTGLLAPPSCTASCVGKTTWSESDGAPPNTASPARIPGTAVQIADNPPPSLRP